MKLLRLKTAFIAVVLPFFAITTTVQAQSAIERLAVPKAKLVSSFWKRHDPASVIAVNHDPWDAFLAKYVRTDNAGVNRVAYGRVSTSDKSALKAYIGDLQNVDVPGLNRNEQYAYWLNLYNASTVLVALDNYPIKSIREVKSGPFDFVGPFNDKVAKVNDKSLTLNEIESGIVRPIWQDPRLHYAFNCAAVTCPNLNKQAYRGDKINQQLNAAARAYVNSPRGITIKGKKVTASKIYFWYEDDFGGSEKAILKHITQYASGSLKSKLSKISDIDDYEYDWTLNDVR